MTEQPTPVYTIVAYKSDRTNDDYRSSIVNEHIPSDFEILDDLSRDDLLDRWSKYIADDWDEIEVIRQYWNDYEDDWEDRSGELSEIQAQARELAKKIVEQKEAEKKAREEENVRQLQKLKEKYENEDL